MITGTNTASPLGADTGSPTPVTCGKAVKLSRKSATAASASSVCSGPVRAVMSTLSLGGVRSKSPDAMI